jgi:glycosyltransferase involved in cell wall biosynthesis
MYFSRAIEPSLDVRELDKILPMKEPDSATTSSPVPALYYPDLLPYDLSTEDLTKHHAILRHWTRRTNHDISIANWFYPDQMTGWIYGGGHYTIYRFADYFSKQGIFNQFVIYNPTFHRRAEDVPELTNHIRQEFPDMKFSVKRLGIDTIPSADIAIATTWQSAYFTARFNKVKGKYYFAQDFEPWFYPSGSSSSLAEFTYRLGMPTITFGKWLRKHLVSNYSCASCQDFVPCADTKVFKPSLKEPRKRVEQVFFFGRPISERRAFEIGILSLEKIKKKHPEISIAVAGWNLDRPLPFPCQLLGNLTIEQTAKLYSNCDIGIVLATTNLSLVPLELMASGCTVLVNKSPTSDWLLVNRTNCISADPLPSLLAEGFDTLLSDYRLRQTLYRNGLKTVKTTSWKHECERVYNFIVTGKFQP